MTDDKPRTLDELTRQLVRTAVREVLQEESAARRNGTPIANSADDGYLSVTKAARLADVAPGTIRAWIRAGRLTAHRAGRVLRVRKLELVQFMACHPTGPVGAQAQRRAEQLFARRSDLRSHGS